MTTAVASQAKTIASGHIRTHRFEVSNYRPLTLSHPEHIQNGKIHLPQVFNIVQFGDVNNDGKLEMIACKGAGEQCVYDLQGRRLWYYLDEKAEFYPIRVDSKLLVFDLDDDGQLEIVCVRQLGGEPHFCVVNAADGEVKHHHPMSFGHTENRLSITPAWLDGPDKPPCIVIHRDYWRIEVYSNDLTFRWAQLIPELGHTTLARDLDGDGRDELWMGTRLFGADGSVIWSKPELLAGTGESHPDSIRIADLDGDGELELLFGPGVRALDARGNVRWELGAELGVTEVQAIRLLRHGSAYHICFTDLPFHDHLMWRGFRMRDVRNVNVITDHTGKRLAMFDGMHVPDTGDWNGDGHDELLSLDRTGKTIEVRDWNGDMVDHFAIQERVYMEMLVLPVWPGAKGDQFIIHEWNDDFSRTDCVIRENLNAGKNGAPFDPRAMAAKTMY